MAKKTAPKKKAAPVKAKQKVTTKAAKPVKAPVKAAPKAIKNLKATPNPVKSKPSDNKATSAAVKPALMTTKGKAPKETKSPISNAKESVIEVETRKVKTVVTMIEESPVDSEEAQKVEKISKIKPVKVDRGNLNDEKAKWVELYKRYGKEKAMAYKMTETFPALVPLQHKVLGWGFVLTNDNDRLEVLFENGIRMLISNYKN